MTCASSFPEPSSARYPRLRMAGACPRWQNHEQRKMTVGVLPVPPKVRLPTLTTGRERERRRSRQLRARRAATAP